MDDGDLTGRLRNWAQGRYWGLVGIETVSARPGLVVNRVVLREEHLNYNDVVHGGVISSLIDSAAGGAVRTLRDEAEIRARPHATSDLHVSYLAPARGTELVAEARVVKMGRTAAFTQVEVRDDGGRLVAMGLVTFVIGTRRQANAEGTGG
ncbi:PaaI family thioesterase [Tepidiforma sp.]|uniref:PaaI family thioesterase n=1 Tax=Tepidiforma sp. TaxID=2682230 RepID=UPI002ADDF523|nr:PaaI family thioesterase [Tepidiforma sp.]